jgi:hypothetical protein
LTPTYTTLLRRTAAAFAAISSVVVSANAFAQSPGSVRLETSSGTTTATECAYGTMSVQPNGAIRVTCSGSITVNGTTTSPTPTPAPPPTVTNGLTVGFSLSTAGGTLATGQTGQVSVTRRGESGAYPVPYVVTGDACATPGSYSVNFANGDVTPKPITQAVFNSTGSTCVVALESGLREGTTVATFTRGSTGGSTGGSTPTQPAGCPAIPSNAQSETFGVKSTHNRWVGDPTGSRVIIAQMPSWSDSTVPSMISMNSPFVYTPSSGTVRYSITKCPGEIRTDYSDACNQVTDVTMWTSYWLPRAMGPFNSKATANASGYCWAPEAEGPWYLNIRYEFNGACGQGAQYCGMMWQYY